MSTLKVDTILKRTGTGTITIGQSGDTISIPSSATLDVASGATADFTGATVTGLTDNEGWKLLKTGSVSSGDGYATLTSVFTSTYKIYKIFFYDWNTSLDAAPYLQWVTGASTVESGSNTYFYAGVGYNTSGGGSNWSGNDDQMQIAGETIRHDSGESFAWEGTLYNPAGTTLNKRLVFSGGGQRTGNYTFSLQGAAEWNATTALTGLKVRPSGGTFDSLSWKIYGSVG